MLPHWIAHVAGALAVVSGGLLLTPPAHAQPKPAAKACVHDILTMEIDTKGLDISIPLKDCLAVLYERIAQKGTEVPIRIDVNAFKEENPDTAGPNDDDVRLPAVPRSMKLAQILQILTSQIRSGNGAFIARNGSIEITTQERAMLPWLLEERIVARFDKTPFDDVIRQLVEMSGAPIMIDPRVQEKAKTPISAELNGNVALAAFLPILADMAEVRVVRIPMFGVPRNKRKVEAAAAPGAGNAEFVTVKAPALRKIAYQDPNAGGPADPFPADGCLYVTTPANAEALEHRLRAERAEQAKAVMGGFGMGGIGGLGGNPVPALPPGTPAAGNPVAPEVAQLQAEIAALRAELARLRPGKANPKKDAK
jgi:hypothetical protein